MFDLEKYLCGNAALVDAELDRRLPAGTTRPEQLHRAMRYSVFAGGKRLRPVLCIASAESSRGVNVAVLSAASALEILHTYTLIHDDLPCMDDDDIRRGKPSLHKAFGEATAVLAGDALLTMAFEWLAETKSPDAGVPAALSLELARAAGSRGVVGGQICDLLSENAPADPEIVDYIHRHKTGSLIRASVRMGAIAAGAQASELAALTVYGEAIGLAFQIVDDILDETSAPCELGKPVLRDRERGKMTFVAAHGLEASISRAEELKDEALSAIAPIKKAAEPLKALAEFIVERAN